MFENLVVLNYNSMNPVGGEGDRDGVEGIVKAWLPPLKTISLLIACQRICFEATRRISTIHKGKGKGKGKGSASKH